MQLAVYFLIVRMWLNHLRTMAFPGNHPKYIHFFKETAENINEHVVPTTFSSSDTTNKFFK